jgi:hypothetical protein
MPDGHDVRTHRAPEAVRNLEGHQLRCVAVHVAVQSFEPFPCGRGARDGGLKDDAGIEDGLNGDRGPRE